MLEDDPIILSVYARKNDLLKTPGWKRLKHIASKIVREKRKLKQMIHRIHISKG